MIKPTLRSVPSELPDPPYPADTKTLPFPIKAFVRLAVEVLGMDAHEAECQFRAMCRERGMEIWEGDLEP